MTKGRSRERRRPDPSAFLRWAPSIDFITCPHPMLASFQRKGHWVSDSMATHCAQPSCGKQFSFRVRRHHCRICGLCFCDSHSSRRLRLDTGGKPLPAGEQKASISTAVAGARSAAFAGDRLAAVAGARSAAAAVVEFQRVCDGCFASQQAPTAADQAIKPQQSGTALKLHVAGEVTARDVTASFVARRRAHNDEKRMLTEPVVENYVRLCQLNSERPGSSLLPVPISGVLSTAASQRVVAWESDDDAPTCGVCHRGFTQLLRRHHCRVCGTVVCADCSTKRPPSAASHGAPALRSCVRCHSSLPVPTARASSNRCGVRPPSLT